MAQTKARSEDVARMQAWFGGHLDAIREQAERRTAEH